MLTYNMPLWGVLLVAYVVGFFMQLEAALAELQWEASGRARWAAALFLAALWPLTFAVRFIEVLFGRFGR